MRKPYILIIEEQHGVCPVCDKELDKHEPDKNAMGPDGRLYCTYKCLWSVVTGKPS